MEQTTCFLLGSTLPCGDCMDWSNTKCWHIWDSNLKFRDERILRSQSFTTRLTSGILTNTFSLVQPVYDSIYYLSNRFIIYFLHLVWIESSVSYFYGAHDVDWILTFIVASKHLQIRRNKVVLMKDFNIQVTIVLLLSRWLK